MMLLPWSACASACPFFTGLNACLLPARPMRLSVWHASEQLLQFAAQAWRPSFALLTISDPAHAQS